ncbi:MAG: L7Ae/L30e/S12e/Gadd45 family ribosomal protein [Saccharofermentanales bacterium]|jgi:ribosomal protein L7Ae-like RNA K-turn-binding protein|nr:hypothetical protein [Clostridiaceae bacterium]
MTRQRQINRKVSSPEKAEPEAVWRMLGLAARAGRVLIGVEGVAKAVRRHKAQLVILAADAAADTAQKAKRLCQQAGVPIRQFGTKNEIGHWTGHTARAIAAVLDDGFGRRLTTLIDQIIEPAGKDRQMNNDVNTTLGG